MQATMTRENIIERLQGVFDDTFMEQVSINADTTAGDVEEWDSLTHVSLVLAVEQAFGIRFRTGEVEWTRNIGDLADLIAKKLDS